MLVLFSMLLTRSRAYSTAVSVRFPFCTFPPLWGLTLATALGVPAFGAPFSTLSRLPRLLDLTLLRLLGSLHTLVPRTKSAALLF